MAVAKERGTLIMTSRRHWQYRRLVLWCVIVGVAVTAVWYLVRSQSSSSVRWRYSIALQRPLMNRVRQQVKRRMAIPTPIPAGLPSTAYYDGTWVHRWLVRGIANTKGVNLTWYGLSAKGLAAVQIAPTGAALTRLIADQAKQVPTVVPGGDQIWGLSVKRLSTPEATPWKITLAPSQQHSWSIGWSIGSGISTCHPIPGTTVERTIAGQRVFQITQAGLKVDLWYMHGWLINVSPQAGSQSQTVTEARVAARHLPTIPKGSGLFFVEPGYSAGQYAMWVHGLVWYNVDNATMGNDSALAIAALVRDFPSSRF